MSRSPKVARSSSHFYRSHNAGFATHRLYVVNYIHESAGAQFEAVTRIWSRFWFHCAVCGDVDLCLFCRRVSPGSERKLLWELFQPWLSNQLPKQGDMYLGYHSTRWLSHTGYIWWIQHAEKFRCFENLRWRFQFKRCAGDLEWWFVGLHLRLQWTFFVVRVHNGREYRWKRFPRKLHSHSAAEYVPSRFSLHPFVTIASAFY